MFAVHLALVIVCVAFVASDAMRFQPIDYSSAGIEQMDEKRDPSMSDVDPEVMRLLAGVYQKLQSEFETQHASELKRKLLMPNFSNQAASIEKKNSDRNTRNYKNCFLSPVQCVMKGRA